MVTKRIVLDTNIIISAFGWNGTPRRVLFALLERHYALAFSSETLQELQTVLAYPKFAFSSQQKESLLDFLAAHSDRVEILNKYRIIDEDLSDNAFIDCAVAAGAAIIVSGDTHLLTLRSYGSIQILTPAEFLKRFV